MKCTALKIEISRAAFSQCTIYDDGTVPAMPPKYRSIDYWSFIFVFMSEQEAEFF